MDALKALRILVKEMGYSNIRIHLIGGAQEAYLKKIFDYIDSEELKEYVLYHGHMEDVHGLMSRMDIGLMCARDEAFGRVTVEYMLHGIPVIASNSGANSELVIPGISGDLYELYNPVDLAGKIEKFINNPDLIEETGKSACEFAIANFTSEKNTREIYQVIEEVLGSQ
jgi:glycosyltransferase involved in cell wall biosynthesis